MRRQDKYPNTPTFTYENRNPYNRITCDCVIRAISKAYGWSWGDTLMKMCNFCLATGYHISATTCYKKFLEANGATIYPQPRKVDGTKYTLGEFIQMHPKGTWLVNMPTHLTVVVNGKNYDIWDCSKSEKKIGVYWKIK